MNSSAQKLRLGDIAKFVSGGTPSKQNSSYWGGDTPWVSAKDLKMLRISSSIDTLNGKGREVASIVQVGTLLILVRGMTLFKSIPIGIAMRDLAINQDLKGLVVGKDVSPEFLAYSLLAKQDVLLQMVESAGHGTGRLDTDALKDLVIRVPRRGEQDRIVGVLSDWDSAIQKTEQLIAAKEHHFAAINHQFLTARKRVNGFSKKWQLRRADEIFENYSQKVSSIERLLSVTQGRGVIPRDMLEGRVTMPSSGVDAFKLVEPGNFVISLRSFQGGLEHSDYRGLVSPAYTVLKEKLEINGRFFRHYFKSADFIKRLSVAVIGIRDGKQISYQDFCSIRLPFPPVDEQKAVAAILDKAEHEISLLRQYAAVISKQKRGLMQKLLTGQWQLNGKEMNNE
jgi:type I restriction enzyme, S subunit